MTHLRKSGTPIKKKYGCQASFGQVPISVLLAVLLSLPATAAEPDLLTFTASDVTRADQLNRMFRLHLIEQDYTFLDPHGFTWGEWNALVRTPIGVYGTMDLVGLGHTGLSGLAMDDQGYVWTGGEPGGWPFPDYTHSGGAVPGWEFNQNGNQQGWTVSNATAASPQGGIWVVSLTGSDPKLISPTTSIDAFHSAYIRVEMKSNAASTAGELFWQTSTQPSFSATRSMAFTVRNDGLMHTYMIPVYRHPEWQGTITKIRIDPALSGGAGVSAEVNRIVGDYDSRHSVTNAFFVISYWRYYMWSGKKGLITLALLPKARAAMNYLQTVMGGNATSIQVNPWNGHNARPGRVNGVLQRGHGIASNYWDILPFGHQDAYASIYYYAALRAMSEIEAVVEQNPSWGVSSNPYGETSASLSAKAASVQTAIRTTFWLGGKRRLMCSKDDTGVLQDFGHIPLNLEAMFYGAVDAFRANLILSWLDGEGGFVVSGDTSQGADIYHWPFAPRATTRSNMDWYEWPYFIWFNPIPAWGKQVQNGGSALFVSFFDVVDRVRHRGPDNAWARLTGILDWFQAAQNAGGYRSYYSTQPDKLQGCGTAGALGIDCEFIESALVPLSFLYGFLGISADLNGLNIGPSLPLGLTQMGVQRLHFRARYYDVDAFSNTANPLKIRTRGVTASHALPLKISKLIPNRSYRLVVTNLSTGTFTTTTLTSSGAGSITTSITMPANGELSIQL